MVDMAMVVETVPVCIAGPWKQVRVRWSSLQ